MIKEEFLNNGTLVRHYSDKGYDMLQVETGIIYGDAVDVVPCRYTYEEITPEDEDKEIPTMATTEYIEEKYDELKAELLDTQMALCDIYEAMDV